MKKFITAVLMLLAFSTAQAQLRKCVGPDGRVTFSDTLCNTNSKSSQTLESAPSSQPSNQDRPSQASVYERELSVKIAAHLVNKDFDSASRLAVTVEQHQMIADAKNGARSEDQAKKDAIQARKDAARAARPSTCYSSGSLMGGSYSGTTTCNK